MRIERVSACEHEYDGRKLAVGEKFDVEPGHIGLLLLLGRIQPEEGEPGYVPPSENDVEQPVPSRAKRNGRSRSL